MSEVKRVLAVLAAVLLLYGEAQAQQQITLTFVGDCTLGCEERLRNKENSFVSVAVREGYAYFLRRVQPLLAQDDLTVANLEGVLKDNSLGEVNKTYCFRGLPDYTAILTQGSVETVSLANNHADDYGKGGKKSTVSALEQAGIAMFDATTPYRYEKDGVQIAFCGFWRASYYRKKEDYVALIQSLRESGADAVVCYLHFGREYSDEHSADQIKMARAMIDAGADLVIGSHPHVVQGYEVYKGRTILYSLGNFVFGGNMMVRANESLIARATLSFGEEGAYLGQQIRLYPANASGDPLAADYQPRLVTGAAAEDVYARVDADSAGQPAYETQTDDYREYPYLPALSRDTNP